MRLLGKPRGLWCHVLLLIVLWNPVSQPQAPAQAAGSTYDRQPPSRAEVSRAIARGVGYLESACGPDGKFAYNVEIGTGRESSSYNVIRHEGAIYALALANRAHPEPRAVKTMVRAADYLHQNYWGPGVRPGQLVVWSKPLTTNSGPESAELGGAGLGLVALAALRKVAPESVPLSDLQGLGRFILFLQREDGSFVSKYKEESGPVPHWDSLYYPGEAAMGLVALYEADHSKDWLIAAAKALSYLARSRVGLSVVPADHWALIATAKLLPYSDQVQSVVSRDVLTEHAMQISASILKEQFHGGSAAGLDGAFDPQGRTSPAATRLEGLLAALEFLPKGELRDAIEVAVGRGVGFLLRGQIGDGPQKGGIPGAIVNRARDSANVRIDYVQHTLCAWLSYEQWLEASDRGSRSSVDNPPGHVRLLFGGDTDFGESYQEEYARKGGTNILTQKGYDYSLVNLASLLQAVDFRVLNLETPLTLHRDAALQGKDYVHYSDPVKSPAALGRFGAIVYSLANNHTVDQGDVGLADTVDGLRNAGAAWFGAGKNLTEAIRPYTQELRVGNTALTVAIFGGLEYSAKYAEQFQFYATADRPGVAPISVPAVEKSIRELRRQTPAVYVIYFMHTLNNYQWKSPKQEATVRALRAAGVDLVVGSGAHMLQEIAYDGKQWVFFGIGNFVFNAAGRYAERQAPPYSLVLVVDFSMDHGHLQTAPRVYPIVSDNRRTGYQPRFLTAVEMGAVDALLAEKSHWNSVERAAIKEGKDDVGYYLEFPSPEAAALSSLH